MYSDKFIQEVSTEATSLLDNYDEVLFYDNATSAWVTVSNNISQVRPIVSEVLNLLKDICRDVILKLKNKHEMVTILTMTVVVREILDVMVDSYGMENLIMYKIPIQLLAAIIFTTILNQASQRLK